MPAWWNQLSASAKFALIGNTFGLAMQMLVPDLGLPDQIEHRVIAVVGFLQAMCAMWSLFIKTGGINGGSAQPAIPETNPPAKT